LPALYPQRWEQEGVLDELKTPQRDPGLHALPYIGGLQLRALQTIHLSDLHTTLLRQGRRDGKPGGLHPRTVGHVHRALHRMLKQAVRWQLIATNPAADLELPTQTAIRAYPSWCAVIRSELRIWLFDLQPVRRDPALSGAVR
jgi:hypothetical protein